MTEQQAIKIAQKHNLEKEVKSFIKWRCTPEEALKL